MINRGINLFGLDDESGLCGASGAVAGAETLPAIFHKRELFQEYPELNRWPLNKVLPSGGHMTIWSDCMLPTTLSGSTL